MKCAAIVCEYNPFHNGHKYHIEETRRICGADAVVAVMSGNWVQRGEAAILDKRVRARAAVAGGADLVLELPTDAAVRSAEFFAAAAVEMIDSLGAVDTLSFGAQCDNADLFLKLARILAHEPEELSQRLRGLNDEGLSYPSARAQAVRELFGDESAEVLSEPNGILGVEYCKALVRTNSKIKPLPISRYKVAHDSDTASGSIASASLIRKMWLSRDNDVFSFMPSFCREMFDGERLHSLADAEKAIIAELIKTPPERLREIADISEGLENRIKKAANSAKTLEALANAVKTKRYTHSRIRRILLSAYLGIEKKSNTCPPYINILAHNERGQELIRNMKRTSHLPLVRNTSQINKLGDPVAKAYWERERSFDRLFELF